MQQKFYHLKLFANNQYKNYNKNLQYRSEMDLTHVVQGMYKNLLIQSTRVLVVWWHSGSYWGAENIDFLLIIDNVEC